MSFAMSPDRNAVFFREESEAKVREFCDAFRSYKLPGFKKFNYAGQGTSWMVAVITEPGVDEQHLRALIEQAALRVAEPSAR